jgi:hypothetical protein
MPDPRDVPDRILGIARNVELVADGPEPEGEGIGKGSSKARKPQEDDRELRRTAEPRNPASYKSDVFVAHESISMNLGDNRRDVTPGPSPRSKP